MMTTGELASCHASKMLILRSPLLDALYMSNVFIPLGCPHSVIEAPNLRSLTIYSHDDDWRIGELPCLEDANIQVTFYPQYDMISEISLLGLSKFEILRSSRRYIVFTSFSFFCALA